MDKLNIFLSWSGPRSLEIAKKLADWLPDVVRAAKPWLSDDSLRKGLQWLPELNKALDSSAFGICILTKENMSEPWLAFEAGVISKALAERHCCPLLCGVRQSEVTGPMASFQCTSITAKDDMLKLIKTMNEACGSGRVEDARLEKWFHHYWSNFASAVEAILSQGATPASQIKEPTDRELLEQILETLRGLAFQTRPNLPSFPIPDADLLRELEIQFAIRRLKREAVDQETGDHPDGQYIKID